MDLVIQNIIETFKNFDGVISFPDLIKQLKKNFYWKTDKIFLKKVEEELKKNRNIFFQIDLTKNVWGLSAYKNRFYWD